MGLIDSWILRMRRQLTKHHPTMSPLDKAWRIIEVLEDEARDYLISKLEFERDDPDNVFKLLT